jgi:excisionase family DNA binding protein
MAGSPHTPSPLQPSQGGFAQAQPETSQEAPPRLTLKEAARQAGCSDSTLRRLVKAGEVPFSQEETKSGFRYMFDAETVSIIAHKAAMRRPSGRPSNGRAGGTPLQASSTRALQEPSVSIAELATLRAERDLLKAENVRLWAQIERLTESVTRLALPPSRGVEETGLEAQTVAGRERRSWWDWFFGRPARRDG